MRKLSLIGALLSSTAYGADIAPYATKAPPIGIPPIMDVWTGFYVGINGGYGWGHQSRDPGYSQTGVPVIDPITSPNPHGGVFGGQAGYNWQRGTWVLGLELDYDGAGLNETQISGQPGYLARAFGPNVRVSLSTNIDALASARGRVGWLWFPDWLVYGTGGLGYGHVNSTFDLADGHGNAVSENTSTSMFGWVAGGGVEWHVPGTQVFLRGEYLHYDFGKQSYSFPVNPFDSVILDVNTKTTVDVARGAISYKF